jgi:hypothetical protein
MIRDMKRHRPFAAWELLRTVAVYAWNLTGQDSTEETPIGRRDQQETDRTKNRQEIHEHIPPKSFSLPIIEPTGRTIGWEVMSQVGLPTLETGR